MMRRGETPSAGGACSARGLAKLGACMVNGGEMDGVRIISPKGCQRMQADATTQRDMGILGIQTNFTQGGVNLFK